MNKINHVTVVADASGSMQHIAGDVVRVMDAQVASLAEQSRHHDQETRITLYTFSSPGHQYFDCLIWDKDVLRMPSIKGLYHAGGGTALCDAMVQAMADLKLIPEKYGDHSHLLYLFTDGMENRSKQANINVLPQMIATLPANWTIAGFVPSATARHYLMRYGFPAGNISIWDPDAEGAVEEAGIAMASASSGYMQARASGVRSVTNLFTMNAPKAADLKKNLIPLTPGSYWFENVDASDLGRVENARIDQFMTLRTGKPYVPGRVYYEMTKRERVQHYKQIAVVIYDKAANSEDVYVGDAARKMLGLPDDGKSEVRVSPGSFRGYKVFIMSTSMNRKLVPGTRVLCMR